MSVEDTTRFSLSPLWHSPGNSISIKLGEATLGMVEQCPRGYSLWDSLQYFSEGAF